MSEELSLEREIFNQVKDSIGKAIGASIVGYQSPLDKMIKDVIERRRMEIETLLGQAVDGALKGDFRDTLQEACTRKLAKVLISKMEGEIEKRANDLRADPTFRARLTVAIGEVVKGIGQEKPET